MMRRRHHDGFTLIELLLVVVISLLAAGIAMPLFVRSFQSSKLRTSARTIVMASKYARSMAVLSQKQMSILFDKPLGRLEVVSFSGLAGTSDRDRFLDSQQTQAEGASTSEGKDKEADAPAPGPIQSDFTKTLPEGINITSFETGKKDQESSDIYWINYYPNGMCDGFEVQLSDKDGKTMTITVDGVSGATVVKNEE